MAALIVFGVAFAALAGYARQASVNVGLETLIPLADGLVREVRDGRTEQEISAVWTSKDVSMSVYRPGRETLRVGLNLMQRDLATGEHVVNGRHFLVVRRESSSETIVVGDDWQGEADSHRIFIITLAIAWLPLAGFVGFAAYTSARNVFEPVNAMAEQARRLSGVSGHSQLKVEDDAEFGQLAHEFNALLDRIWSEVSRREQLVADVAHDLRTPLTVIRGRLEMVLLKQAAPPQTLKSVGIAVEEAERLSGLIDMILESGSTTDETAPVIDLRQIVEGAGTRWSTEFARSDVRLEVSAEPASAAILAGELDRCLDNLLDNAKRYAPAGTAVSLTLKASDGGAEIQIADQGPGIPPEEAERVFERFVRLDASRNRVTGGSGLGLAVVKQFITRRGGTIEVVPANPGAKFVIRLPGSQPKP